MYNVLLFAHITGVVLLSSAIMLEIVSVVRLLSARDVATARSALASIKVIDVLAPIASVIVIVFGLSMVAKGGDTGQREFNFNSGWLVTVYIVFAIMLAVGPGVNGKRLTAIKELADGLPDGPLPAQLLRARRDPLLSFTVSLGPCAIVLALFLMTNKPRGAANVIAAGVALVVAIVLSRVWQARVPTAISGAAIPAQATEADAAV